MTQPGGIESSDPEGEPRAVRPSPAIAITRKQLIAGAGVAGAASALPAIAGAQLSGRTREYWVAAVPITWNVVPNGRDAIEGQTFAPDRTVFRTVVYRGFTRGWRRPLPAQPFLQAGITGPFLRAAVGDTIKVHFKNMDSEFRRPHSMHFHGVHYRMESDGAFIPGFSGRGADVKPGQQYTYTLRAGPQSAGIWPYHDHSPSMHDSIAGGMYGALSIDEPGASRPDREFLVFFGTHQDFMTINGRAFVGNTPVFRARVGQRVRWNVLAIGEEFHTFHIHGHRWRGADGGTIDTRVIGPAESFRFSFLEDAAGAWPYHCHVEGHMANGMIGIYRVLH